MDYPVLICAGRAERVREIARERGLKERSQWRCILSLRDIYGYSDRNRLLILDSSAPELGAEWRYILDAIRGMNWTNLEWVGDWDLRAIPPPRRSLQSILVEIDAAGYCPVCKQRTFKNFQAWGRSRVAKAMMKQLDPYSDETPALVEKSPVPSLPVVVQRIKIRKINLE
jgi:hypothetical protein